MVKLQNVEFSYNRKKNLFSDLNLNLQSGQVYGLVGRNGAGKTTLLKLVAGIRFPKTGGCLIAGYDPRRRESAFLQKLFFVPERSILPEVTIAQYAWLFSPFYPGFNHDYFLEIVSAFSLGQDNFLPDFSNGDQRKVLLAFALASGCSLLLLDEPTLALDIPARSIFKKYLASFISENNCALISSHQIAELSLLIDSLLLIDQGEIPIRVSMAKITEKLFFCQQTHLPPKAKVLYLEQRAGGNFVLCENNGYEESAIDLELLFKSFLYNKETLIGVLQ